MSKRLSKLCSHLSRWKIPPLKMTKFQNIYLEACRNLEIALKAKFRLKTDLPEGQEELGTLVERHL